MKKTLLPFAVVAVFWPYIQSIRLNGNPLNQVWFLHADVVNGGTLELQMGYTPNEKLGSDPASFPPSEMAFRPSDFERPH
jgi:putative alpha-1,2-mannosidase